MEFRAVLQQLVASLEALIAMVALIRKLAGLGGVSEFVHLQRPRLAEFRGTVGEVAFVTNSEMRRLNVSVEVRFLLVLIGTTIARIFPFAGVVAFV